MFIQKLLMLLIALFSFTVIGSFEEKTTPLMTKEISKLQYQKFYEHTQTRLPLWQPLFKKYARENHIPWALLAAVAYQESKWDQTAVSYTGVKGMMQITLKTAEYLGIEDREDPEQSIQGGAFYLRYLFNKTPAYLSNYERWTQALSGYNIGWAHVRDARRLAVELKKNPYRWKDMKKVLPKLEDEEHFSKLTFGYARGRETVQFVDNVLVYYKLLSNAPKQTFLTSADELNSNFL
jgi:membrane-bound lytic murein transglycosylase F